MRTHARLHAYAYMQKAFTKKHAGEKTSSQGYKPILLTQATMDMRFPQPNMDDCSDWIHYLAETCSGKHSSYPHVVSGSRDDSGGAGALTHESLALQQSQVIRE